MPEESLPPSKPRLSLVDPCIHGDDYSFVCVNSALGIPLKPPSTFCHLPLMKNPTKMGSLPHAPECGEISRSRWCLGLINQQGAGEDYEVHCRITQPE